MKKYFIACIYIIMYYTSFSQNKISGIITDINKLPLPGATVYIPDINKGTITNAKGYYELLNLPSGKIKIQYSFVGYSTHIETVELSGPGSAMNISLKETAIETEEIVISGGYSSSQHDNAVKIELLKLNPMELRATPNFSEILTKIPGVDMISKGSGVSKPVIRGLSMNDILILNNGVRFENYQYSSHHPLGIDEFGIEDVEIIKGPASLIHGSDAIGGVINFIKEKPAAVGSIIGDYNLQLFSNSLGITNNLGIKGTSKKFYGGLRIGQKSNADYLQGNNEYVPNSRFNEMSFKANAGYTTRTGSFKLFYDFNNQKLGLVEDEAVEEIIKRGRKNEIFYQEFNTHLLSSQNKLYLKDYKLEFNTAYQNTELTHFGEANIFEIQMKLATLTYETKLYFPSKKNSEYILGFQGFNQSNTNVNDMEIKLLPDAITTNHSVFGLIQYPLMENLKLQSGIRYDFKSITTKAIGLPPDTMSYRPDIGRSYRSFSGSAGATYNQSEELLFRANFAAAFRTPNLAELTSNGQHELRYEVGDKDLVPENSYEADLNIHYHKDNITIDVAGFYNIIDNYIFIAPTGDSTATGISIYTYRQSNSFLFGGEAGFHIHPRQMDWLHFAGTFSTVSGKQANGENLPFIPASKLNMEIRAEKEKLFFIHHPYFTVNSSIVFDQDKAAPEESTTSGYALFDVSMGGRLKLQNQLLSISISANNIFDRVYIDHLSTLKEVNYFNPGRNLTITLKIPFGITKPE
ncbi:MAG: TonB-dependent receptor [Bacteroidales bacterium]